MTVSIPLANGGMYEVFVGVSDLDVATAYWKAFGYSVEKATVIEAKLARELYGYDQSGQVRRLRGSADHGLVRLIQWDTPANAGLGLRGLRFTGNRWTGQFARSVLDIANHAAAAAAQGAEMVLGPIHFIDMGRAYAHLFGGAIPQPFADTLLALREIQLFQPESRQVFLERFGYDSPLLGTFADSSLLRTTQIVQGCMVVASDDPGIFDFYHSVLGLWKSLDHPVPWDEAQASREVFGLTEGELHWNVDLDEPASRPGLAERRSGRLKCFRFSPRWPIETVHELASPGSLGLSNYTWRVHDIAEARARAIAAGACGVTEVIADEFGDHAISFRAPDGYFWTLIQQK